MPVLGQVLKLFPDKVNVVFKHFPLSRHQFARVATASVIAAGEQGKFWEFHDALFDQYASLNAEKIQGIASDLGLDMARFATDRDSPRTQQIIDEDLREGELVGVRGTPSLYINGRKIERGLDRDSIAREVDRELKNLEKSK